MSSSSPVEFQCTLSHTGYVFVCFVFSVCALAGVAGQLGALPPPELLVSLPVCTAPIPMLTSSVSVTPTSIPLQLTTTTPMFSMPPGLTAPTPASVGHTAFNTPPIHIPPSSPAPSPPGMILSPAADPIPHGLVQRIQSGQFVEMRDLLADNIALLNQLSSLHGTVPLPLTTVNRTRLREVPSLVSWLYCFNAYVAVRTSDPSTRDMLTYSRLLIREALRHGGSGWMEYDRVFRKQRSINPCLAWNTLEPALQAATILGQSTSAGTYCTICRECDHNANHCALSTLQQQLHPTSFTTPQSGSNPRPPKRIETLMQICVAWNKGTCRRPDCKFRHVCATCQLGHRAHSCPNTPVDSPYRNVMSAYSGATTRPPIPKP